LEALLEVTPDRRAVRRDRASPRLLWNGLVRIAQDGEIDEVSVELRGVGTAVRARE